MVSRHPNIWNWLGLFTVGLLVLVAFAPLPAPIDRITTRVGTVLLVVYVCLSRLEERRERRAAQSSNAAISSSDQT
jgi:hypothetical protein